MALQCGYFGAVHCLFLVISSGALLEKTTWASMGSPLLNFSFSSRFGF